MQNQQKPRRGQTPPKNNRQSAPRSAQNPTGRPPQGSRPRPLTPEEAARRREAIERRRAAEAARERQRMIEENRRRARRKQNMKLFAGRTLVFIVILLLLAAVTVVGFIIHFNHTNPEKEPSQITYVFGGADAGTLTEDIAYRDGILYIDFHELAGYLGFTPVGGGDSMRYVITHEGTDSAGDGTEEVVLFNAVSDLCEVNGQSVRLEGKVFLSEDHYLVPLSFISEYIRGVTVQNKGKTVSVARNYTDEENMIEEEVSFTLKPIKPIDPIPDDSSVGDIVNPPVTTDPPTPPATEPVSFKSDLSAYEQYMNPADRDGYLLLVNSTSTIDETYLPNDLTNLADTRKDGRNTQQMKHTAAMALEAMFIELRANGFTDVSVTSAYRSYSYQSYLFNMYTEQEMSRNPSLTRAEAEAITETYSARPGTSEHQTGLCCDMHNLSSAQTAFANQAAYKWLKENCWKFGFIIRFPEGKQDITGISFEPWHYRFVGRYHAKAIHDSGLCLEEYLETIG